MTRLPRLLWLRWRAWFLQQQILHAEALLLEHEANLKACYMEMRKIKIEQAMLTPARTLLAEALRRK